MLNVPDNAAVYLWTKAMDMLCGFDRLVALVKDQIGKQVTAGGVYVFLSRSRDRVKLLWWDADGYALFYKRLEAGTFKVEWRDGCEELTGVDLKLLLEGLEMSRIKMRRAAAKGVYG